MGHRTSNDEMMRVPRDFADYVRTEAPKRGFSFADLMREMTLTHMDAETEKQAKKAKKAKRGPREPVAEKALPRVTVAS